MADGQRPPATGRAGSTGSTGSLGDVRLSRRRVLELAGGGSVAAVLGAGAVGASAAVRRDASSGAGRAGAEGGTGTIRVGVDGTFERKHEWLPWAGFGQQYALNYCAQRLVSTAPDGTIVPDMAERWEVSDDAMTYTFFLRPGAKWHDGMPVTAADVAFTFNTQLKTTAGSTQTSVLPVVGAADVKADESKDASGIQVVDDTTIRFVLEAPNNAVYEGAFGAFGSTFIAPRHPFEGVPLEEYVKLPIHTGLFIGSGPYRMVENRPSEFVNFEAYPDYVLGPPGAAAVSIRVYGDLNAQVLGVEAGEVDLAYIRGASDDIIERLSSLADHERIPQAVGVNINFAMTQREYLQDKRIRQAFLHAIDRQAIAEVRGRGVAPAEIINDWTAPFAVAPDLNPYDFDPEKARSLLADAGWDPTRVVDAKWDGPPTGVDELPLMQQMWQDVGIQTKLTRVDSASLIKVLFEDMDYDIYINISSGQLGGSPWAADLSMGCEMAYPNGYNGWGYCNPAWDEAYRTAVTATDIATRDAALQEASRIFNDELPYMPYFQRLDQAAVSRRLAGPQDSQLLHYFAGGNKYWEWTISE